MVCLLAVTVLMPEAALGWNSTGHEVVARIAWEKMEPQTRLKVVELILQAPADADLANLLPQDARPLVIRQRDLFMLASTWPDIVRDEDFPERQAKYHHTFWHFINFFWRQQNGVAIDVPEMQPESVNIVERLIFLQSELSNDSISADQRGIDAAWILHLIGDIHQPLHDTARVTNLEPKGDQGGNLFLLTPKNTPSKKTKRLHGFWDDILNKSIPPKVNEADLAYANRIAALIMQRHPESTVNANLKPGEYMDWAREGLTITKASVYPPWLRRFQTPSETYRRRAYNIAESQIALAGYRLADTLDRLFSK
jgi:nuclease S1